MSESATVVGANNPADGKTANIVYILYLVGLVIGVTSLVGLVMAYVNKSGAPEWVQSHYRFQIRTFWIGVLFSVIGVVTIAIFIGLVILLFVAIWIIVRCVKGMKYLSNAEPYPNPTTWLW
jgi:uncharacterized membrane protein